MSLMVSSNRVIRSRISGDPEPWVRSYDWLTIPSIATGEEVIYILMAVYNVVGNFAALSIEGDYTVDWGDGNIENVGFSTTAEHSYNWDDVGDLTSEGFRQALIKITPQAGSNITFVDLQQYHSSISIGKRSQFVDIVLNIPNLTGTTYETLLLGYGTSTIHSNVQRCWVKEVGVLTDCYGMFSGFQQLQNVPLFDTSNVVRTNGMFTNCHSLVDVPLFDTSSVWDISNMFYSCYALKELPAFDFSSVTSAISFCYYCYNLVSVEGFDFSKVTNFTTAFQYCKNLVKFSATDLSDLANMYRMFLYCDKLKIVSMEQTSSLTNMSQAFYQCYDLFTVYIDDCSSVTTTSTTLFLSCLSVVKNLLVGITIGFSVAGGNMSATELNALFTSLGTANGAQSITITGNYGAGTCDQTIATTKGWTIVN